MDAIFKFYEGLPRQGPGSTESTLRALEMIENDLPQNPKILDIGCGTGAQTITLAENIGGSITAVDIYPPYLDMIIQKAKNSKLHASINVLNQSMSDLSFPEQSIDLIWSEGAIYLMGFESGLKLWAKFLKPLGFMAITELSWFKDNRPKEAVKYWLKEYPGMNTVEENLKIIKNTGLQIVNHFPLPSEVWWINYYDPVLLRIKEIRDKYPADQDFQELIEETLEEIEIFKSFSNYYGYEFYIVQKFD